MFLASPLPSHGEKQSSLRQILQSPGFQHPPPLVSGLPGSPARTATHSHTISLSLEKVHFSFRLPSSARSWKRGDISSWNCGNKLIFKEDLVPARTKSPTSLLGQEVWLLGVPATQKSPYISTVTSKLPESFSVPTAFGISTIWGRTALLEVNYLPDVELAIHALFWGNIV